MIHLSNLLIGLCFCGYGTPYQHRLLYPLQVETLQEEGGTASYSVGQIGYTKNRGTNGTVAKGVQQPYEISVIMGLEEALGISLVSDKNLLRLEHSLNKCSISQPKIVLI